MAYHAWDANMTDLITRFRRTDLPERFVLARTGEMPSIIVANCIAWRKSLELDIAQGPRGPRMKYGALKLDLDRTLKAAPHGIHGQTDR